MARGTWWLAGSLTAAAACGGGMLQPGGMPDGGSRGGTAGAMSGGQGGGGAGGTAEPVRCGQIATGPGIFNPCGKTFSLAYSPDGRLLAAGMAGPRPNGFLWRLSDGLLVRHIDSGAETNYQVAFSPDSALLATAGGFSDSGSGSGTSLPEIVKLWNVVDGRLVRTIPAHCGSYASTAAFSNDGTMLVTAGALGPVEVWRVSDGALLTSISYPTSVHNARFSPDDKKVIVGGVDRRATVWSLPAGGLMMTLDGTADEMADAAFSPDGGEIATTGPNNALVVWDGTTGAMHQMLPGHEAFVSHVLWIGRDRLISNDWGGAIKSWIRSGADFVASADWAAGGQSLGIAVSPDQTMLAVGGGVDGFWFVPVADLSR